MAEVICVLDIQNTLGEGPTWYAPEAALYWVDIMGNCFHRLDPATGAHQRFEVGLPVGTVVPRERGGFVLATRDGFEFWDAATGRQPISDPEADKPKNRFNDGKVDRAGRFWAGTMGDGGPVGAFYRLDPDLTVHTMATGIRISNGLGWSPDNTVMYYTDSGTRIIYAYDYDAATGAISNRRDWVVIPEGEGSPDGLTVDSEGCVWSARWDGWRIARFDPDGRLMQEIAVPVQRPTSVMFGGPDLNQLYITSARTGFSEADLEAQPQAGGLFRVDLDVKGLPETPFKG